MDDLILKLKEWKQKYGLMLITTFLSACFFLSIASLIFSRHYAVGVLKNQFDALEKTLQSIGYDYAYDDLKFYTFSPWQIMRAKNFKIYSLDEEDFISLDIEELNIDVSLFNHEKVNVYLGKKQSLQVQYNVWDVSLPSSKLQIDLKHNAIKDIVFEAQNVHVKNLLSVEDLLLKIKHQSIPYMTTKLDVKGIQIDDMTGWPLNKSVDHFFVYASMQGSWDTQSQVSDAFYHWLDLGGSIVVHKAILNWKPLIMVANGDISFDAKVNPIVSLNTASLAMLETLERLNENGFVSNKGAFVAKILLNNKAVQQNPSDKYKTVVTPLKITKDAVMLENIKIR